MKIWTTLAAAGLLALAAQPSVAQQANMVRVSGVVDQVKGDELDLTATDGSKVAVKLGDKTRYSLSEPITLDTIKPGSFVGAGAMADGKGGNTAMEITVFPEALRGLGEGFRKWDHGPNSTMTNGTVSEVVGTANRVLTVTYKGGQQQVAIPDGTPITTFSLVDKTALTPGGHVLVRAIKGGDGQLTGGFITVGKDGSTPAG